MDFFHYFVISVLKWVDFMRRIVAGEILPIVVISNSPNLLLEWKFLFSFKYFQY